MDGVVDRTSAEPADPMDDERLWNSRSDRELKRKYAKNLYRAMIGQIILADLIFVAYAHLGATGRSRHR